MTLGRHMDEHRSKHKHAKVATVVRFHDASKIEQLERCLLSLMGQSGVSVTPIITLQNFSTNQVAKIESKLRKRWWRSQHDELHVLNVSGETGQDLRAKLLNQGIQQARSNTSCRFLAILDYDDILFSSAYKTLTRQLLATKAAVAFARVHRAKTIPLYDYDYVFDVKDIFKGKSKSDLMHDNFCPIHSYMFDLSKLSNDELWYDESMVELEDYGTLLKICATHLTNFEEIDKFIGLYFWRSDDSNSINTNDSDMKKKARWKIAQRQIADLKQELEVKFWASEL